MLALATTSIAWILLAIVVVGWIFYALLNAGSARKEVGSEIELAANRKPYYDDEMLEGKRLERVQLMGVLLLVGCRCTGCSSRAVRPAPETRRRTS